ncbi:MAG: flippase-like domain-containing protein [Candidatus Marsarchaeota archaeon]|jgi:uncharacterized protein (TIRG00374 family)|nr:flippase-like domain-containing protein [Candidatus Marsarchaeota archaeon]
MSDPMENPIMKKGSIWYTIAHIEELDRDKYINLVRGVAVFVGAAILVSLAVFVVIAWIGGIGNVVNIILRMNLYLFSLGLLAVFASYLLRFWKWRYYLDRLHLKVPRGKNLIVYLSLYSMNITPGMLGRFLVGYTISRLTKMKAASVIPIVTMDIFTDFIGTAIVALAASLYFHTYVLLIIGVDIVLLIPYAFILSDWFYRIIKRIFKGRRMLEMFTLFGDEYFASQSALNTTGTYAVSLAVTIPAAILTALALFFTLAAVGITPHFASSVFIYTSTQVLGMATAVPGSIGVTDGALVALLSASLHIGTDIASAVTILTRFATLWFGTALGGVLLIYSLRYWSESIGAGKSSKRKKKKEKG